MYSYDGLVNILKEKNMTRSMLADDLGVSSRTIAKIGRGEKIADHVLNRIADYLGCKPVQLCAVSMAKGRDHRPAGTAHAGSPWDG